VVTVAYDTVVKVRVRTDEANELEVVEVVVVVITIFPANWSGELYKVPATFVLLVVTKPDRAELEKEQVPGPTPLTPLEYQNPVQPDKALQSPKQSFQLFGAGCCAKAVVGYRIEEHPMMYVLPPNALASWS
jgi:hypothetical protein